MPKAVLITYVWPEPKSSAAGLRDWNLIETFLGAGWDLVVASASQANSYASHIQELQVKTVEIRANDSSFDAWIRSENPDFVIFDRFVVEEQFGWRVKEACPEATRVLDTQDLHFLRRTRHALLQQGATLSEVKNCELRLLNEDTFREIASIYRCDGVFVLSSFEYGLLLNHFHVPQNAIQLSRFHYPTPQDAPSFHERKDFVMIGNFRHLPNQDAVRWLASEVWPLIRARLPEARVSIYGAYPSKEMMSLSSEKDGFFVRGPIIDQFKTMRQYRVNLAPLRFGAGIKGKITDGWWVGTPVAATSIAAEGMIDELPFGGMVADDPSQLARVAVELYENRDQWSKCQGQGYEVIQGLYRADLNSMKLLEFLLDLRSQQEVLRSQNWLGDLLSYHAFRSSCYFSKWIEEKSKRLSHHEDLN
jgi:glycosyltransferase involved in cell wall biosynthesis